MTALLLMSDVTYADQFDRRRLDRLASLISTAQPLQTDLLHRVPAAQLAEVSVLLTGWGAERLDAPQLEALPRLAAVLHCAGSVKSIVSPALWRRGIQVSSAAEVNAIPVAEFTFAAVVMAGKKAPFLAADARIHREDWSYRTRRGPLSNLGLTVGVVGFSRIGRRVVEKLRQLDDVTILVSDPFVDHDQVAAAGARLVDLDQLLPCVDVLSIHAPELPSTRHLIDRHALAKLKNHTTVINTARGPLIDTAALETECVTGRLNAILDVTDPEPLPADSPLYELPNVMITPHIAGSLGQEIRRMTDTALDELERLRTGQPLRHAVLETELHVHA